MEEAVIIFPHQLFKNHPCLSSNRLIYLAELDYFFKRFFFHKQKIALHYASMQYYCEFLKKQGYNIVYCSHNDVPTLNLLMKRIRDDGIATVYCTECIEHELAEELRQAVKKYNIVCNICKSPMFITSEQLLSTFFDRNIKRFIMGYFYQKQRKELNILINKNGEPVGGKWSFDELNRESLPEDLKIPKPYIPELTKYHRVAKEYVNQFYKKNPGELEVRYAVTHAQAELVLKDFLEHRLSRFGPYQDALSLKSSVLFHSQLSLLLNIGLLTPDIVITKTLDYAQKHEIPLNSLEGFIRQIIPF